MCITIYYSLKSWVQKMFVVKEAYSCIVKPYVKTTHIIHDEAQQPGLI